MNTFQEKIISWYNTNKRNLPWRNTTNPYHILVSEIMLQQTQVSRVIEKFNQFIKAFPTLEVLASATKQEILSMWIGLGFNSRALRLQKTAQILVSKYNSLIPKDELELQKLPGIGPYTSRSIVIFAYNKDIVTIDTNIRRILIHEFQLPANVSDKELEDIAKQNLLLGQSRKWHNALMDYGALVLTTSKTGIPAKTKQSTFKGSKRETRAAILKTIVRKGPQKKSALEKQHTHTQFQEILEQLEKEKIIEITNNICSLQE